MTLRFVLLLCVAVPLTAAADKKRDAQAHIDKAMAAHAQDNFEGARAELEAAYAIDPAPQLLYAIGQIHVKLDRCPEAIRFYERFLATKPAAQAKADTEQAIATCQKRIAAQPPVKPEPDPELPPTPTPDPTPAPAPTPPAPAPAPTTSPATASVTATTTAPRPWYKDKLGGALVITGVTAGIVGGLTYRSAVGDLDAAEDAGSLADYRDRVDNAKSKRTISVVFMAGGAALVGAGIVRYVLLRRGSRRESRMAIVPTPDGGGLVTLGGQF